MATIQSIEECPLLPEVPGVQFRHCPGFVGYAVGSDGSVFTCMPRGIQQIASVRWKPLSACSAGDGYRIVVLVQGRRRITQKVSVLVATAFHGPRQNGMECCRTDGNRLNDVAVNVRWDTRSNNHRDAVRHGTFVGCGQGESHAMAKLSNAQVREIRALNSVLTKVELASRFGVHYTYICAIVRHAVRRDA